MKSFASDNFASVHPKIMEALLKANIEHSFAYGDDPWTEQAKNTIEREFGTPLSVFFVYGGTGANVCSLSSCIEKFDSVLCASSAHIYTDECGAPERFLGSKLQPITPLHGKLSPDLLEPFLPSHHSEHHARAKVLSVTQATELGTVYSLEELRALGSLCKKHQLFFHMDGARLYNAAVALNTDLASLTHKVGVDILSLGGTKNGLMYGEAIVVFNQELAKNLRYLRKQSMQLASKMRFISAQFEALFQDSLWKANAKHANLMAQRLLKGIDGIKHIEVIYPVEANALFVKIPSQLRKTLLQESFFWDWDEKQGIVRWMTSFDTTEKEVDLFLEKISQVTI